MTGSSVAELISQLIAVVDSLEKRARTEEVKLSDLEDLKGSVDDARLRLWVLMRAPTGGARVDFEERFRIRRATELCGRLASDLDAGKVNPREPEFADLVATSEQLARAIQAAR